jgi:hypothetical protein
VEQQEWSLTQLELLLIVVGGCVVVTSVFLYALMRAARYPPPILLVTSLSMLTLIALLGAIVTDNSAVGTIAATGIGAVAGAVAHQFTSYQRYIRTDELVDQSESDEWPPGPST